MAAKGMTREELIGTICWSCWEKEGGRCYSDFLGEIPTDPETGLRVGHEITEEHIGKCGGAHYESKREVLSKFFPPEIELVIPSENAKKGGGFDDRI